MLFVVFGLLGLFGLGCFTGFIIPTEGLDAGVLEAQLKNPVIFVEAMNGARDDVFMFFSY